MIRVAVLFSAALLASAGWADEFRFSAPVVSARVHPSGGQITRVIEADLPQGRHQLLLPRPGNMPDRLPRIRAAGVSVKAVTFRPGGLVDPQPYLTERQAALKARLDALREAERALAARRRAVESRIAAAEARRNFVDGLDPAFDSAPSVEALRDLAQFVQAQNGEVAAEIQAARRDMEALDDEARDLDREIQQARADLKGAGLPEPGGDLLILTVEAETAGPARIELDEQVRDMGWGFDYLMTLNREGTPRVTLDRNVRIYQNSGLAWQDVDLRLEASDLNRRADPSDVWPDKATIYEGTPPGMMERSLGPAEADVQGMVVIEEAPMAETQTQGLALSYVVADPVNLAVQDEAQLRLDSLTMPAREIIRAVPRTDETAYLVAEFVNSTDEMILPGMVRRVRDGQEVGEGVLPLVAPGATQELGFGPFDQIRLEVNFDRNDTGDRGVIRSRQTRRQVVTVSAENLSDEAQNVRMLYALPFSEQEDLVVRTQASQPWDALDVDGKRGVAAWDLALAPGERRDIRLQFDLDWPEGMWLDWRP